MAPALKWRNRPWIGFQWLFFREGSRSDEPLRGRRLHPQQRRRRLPERDVPLPPHRRPLRRHRARWRARVPGPRRPDVLRRPGFGEDHDRRSRHPSGAALQLPVDGPGPPRVGGGGPGGADHPRPARVRPLRRRRALARAGGRDRRADPGVGGPGRRDRAPPVVHVRHGHRSHERRRPAHDGRARGRRPPRGRCLVHALRHQRQHLRPRDDAGREGRGPDRRQPRPSRPEHVPYRHHVPPTAPARTERSTSLAARRSSVSPARRVQLPAQCSGAGQPAACADATMRRVAAERCAVRRGRRSSSAR